MTLTRRTTLAGLAALAGCAHLSPAPATLPDALAESVGNGLDGLIVYVDRKGSAPQSCAAGWKDRASQMPSDPQALFKIASISKLYIAAAAAKLVAGRRLSLDGTLADDLPDLAQGIANADRITLKQLLQHRSGLFNITDAPQFPWFAPLPDPAGYLALARGRPALFEPGTRHHYSNTNYLLIGALLDRKLGHSHQRYIEQALLAPLGLTHTYARVTLADAANLVSGHHPAHAGDLKTVDYPVPGGSMVATAQDVGVFLRALRDGVLLTADEQAIYSSVSVYEHTGLLPGYLSIARHHRDLDAVVVLFANTSAASAWGQIEAAHSRVVRVLSAQRPPARS
ncbi:serine hydrolase domain-containing protein [Roseateles sp. LYH14W]|uniref:Serine hydrolase domain-containing protein n=1 Tax=Pelomonas parva TaxID=3299032 RepID=A0ABW7F7Z9_9BURK